MKVKSKAFNIACSALSLLLFTAGATGCHTHVVKWSVKKEATCVSTGVREGVCNLCGQVFEETLPVDENAHEYGEWLVEAPTTDTEGAADKICKNDSSHTLSVTLPVLKPDHGGYLSSQVIKEPTAFEQGERQYVFEHASGDVVFTVPIEETGVESVGDAVSAAAKNKKQVRRGTVLMAQDRNHNEPSHISYEFGNDYTHIIDNADNIERWYSLEDGAYYGMVKPVGADESELKPDVVNAKAYLNGYHFGIPYAGSDFPSFYGAEELVVGIYGFIKKNNNRDYSEEIAEENDRTVYKVSYNYVNGNTYFCMLDMSFTLSSSYALKTVEFTCKQYIKGTFEFDEETGVGGLIDPDSPDNFYYDTYIKYEQTLLSELPEEERDKIPVNPYGKDFNKVLSFGLDYLGDSVDGEELVSITADVQAAFTITNLQPASANLSLDPIEKVIYCKDGKDIELSALTLGSLGAAGYFDASRGKFGAVILRCHFAGESKFAVVTASGYRKEFTVFIKRSAPTRLNPSVYERSALGGNWNDSANRATVYVGQTLTVRALVPESDRAFADNSFISSVSGEGVTVQDTTFMGENVAQFVATATGEYTITLTSAIRKGITAKITVVVVSPPSVAEIFKGTYAATVNDVAVQGDFKLEFTPSEAGGTSGEVKLTYNDGSFTVFTYRYEENAEQPDFAGKLVTEYKSGANNRAVAIDLTDAYTIELAYPTGFTDNAGNPVVVIIPLAKTAE